MYLEGHEPSNTRERTSERTNERTTRPRSGRSSVTIFFTISHAQLKDTAPPSLNSTPTLPPSLIPVCVRRFARFVYARLRRTHTGMRGETSTWRTDRADEWIVYKVNTNRLKMSLAIDLIGYVRVVL